MQDKFNSEDIKIIIGLGNPGAKYKNTYHNAGTIFIDYLKENSSIPKQKLIKSDVFMNESGRFVKQEIEALLKLTDLVPRQIVVVHDDSDLNLGEFKFSFGSGSAGHNGVASVIDALKTKDFWRLRIGIRNDGEQRRKAEEFVLNKISPHDKKILTGVFNQVLEKELGPL